MTRACKSLCLFKLALVGFLSFPVRALTYFVTNKAKSGLLSLAFEAPLNLVPFDICSPNSHCTPKALTIPLEPNPDIACFLLPCLPYKGERRKRFGNICCDPLVLPNCLNSPCPSPPWPMSTCQSKNCASRPLSYLPSSRNSSTKINILILIVH